MSISTAIQVTMVLMASAIAICGYKVCSEGKYTCTL